MTYLLVVSNLFCNHKCTYCIQQESSLDVRMNPDKVDVDILLKFLGRNRIAHSVKLMGGESTMHPDFEKMMDGLLEIYPKVVLTTNLNGKWYRKFPETLEKMKRWKRKVKWNTTFHPAWMEADVYIERVRTMKEAGLWLDQVAATDTPQLTPEIADKLHNADIGWKLQIFTGRNEAGELMPRTWDDVRTQYPLLYYPSKYIDHYEDYQQECEDANYSDSMYRAEWVSCTTSYFLIGPDNLIYPCHRHLYAQDRRYASGSLEDVEMSNFKFKWSKLFGRWTMPCDTKCNPCDFRSVKLKPMGKPAHPPARLPAFSQPGPPRVQGRNHSPNT
ncbi:MAG: radical SAM protein [SAR324 cluster bacterium]|nr:radical SAM protein [SAR324 cluster bacterium]